MTDQAAAARDRLTLAARDAKHLETWQPLADAAIGIGHALLTIADRIEVLTAAITGPDGVNDGLQAIAAHGDRISSDIAEIARLANRR